jgi:hypothetical protein
MDKQKLAAAFNEWMKRYTEHPEKFDREFQAITTFLSEQAAGYKPTYGEACAAYLMELMG